MSRLLRGGGWTPAGAVGGDASGASCAFCFGSVEGGWVHVARLQAVCHRCLPDPNRDDGEAGRAAVERLEAHRAADFELGLY